MVYHLIEDKEALKDVLLQASNWLEGGRVNELSVTCIAYDKERPALSFVIGHGGFSDPATIYALHIPSLRVEFRVYSNSFSSRFFDIEWNISSQELRLLECEINQTIYEAWLCFNSKWGKRKENSSMSVSHQGEKVKMVVS